MASSSILELAAKFNRQVRAERVSALRQLDASLKGQDAAKAASPAHSVLRQKMRAHLSALLRVASGPEKLLRRGRTPTGIPRYVEMSRAQWIQSDGPFHVVVAVLAPFPYGLGPVAGQDVWTPWPHFAVRCRGQ